MDLPEDLLAHLFFALLIVASLLTPILYIRLSLIFAGLAALAYYSLDYSEPYWVGIIWSTLFTLVNFVQLIRIRRETPASTFRNQDEKLLYEIAFRNFSIDQYKKVISKGTFLKAEPGEMLTEEGKPVLHLNLLYKGQARVVVKGETIAYCHPGNLIGEMSFLSGAPASATVYTFEPTSYIQWSQAALRDLLNHDPELKQAFQGLFNLDFLRKFAKKETTVEGSGSSQ